MEENVMKWKTGSLSVILLLLFASQGWADPLDHCRVRNQSYINALTYANKTFVDYHFSAVGQAGTVATSKDGIDWDEQSSGVDSYLWGITRAAQTFVAVGDNGTIITSPNGVTWTKRSSGTGNGLYGATYGKEAFVVVGDFGTILQSQRVPDPAGGQ
jgi:hypothetical protein